MSLNERSTHPTSGGRRHPHGRSRTPVPVLLAVVGLLVAGLAVACSSPQDTASPPSAANGDADSEPPADNGEEDEPDEPACSAADMDAQPEPQPGLPDPVAATRAQIVAAATSCDYDRLGELAGEEFTYSFGGGDDFSGFLRRQEADERGPQPLRYLVGLLNRPHGTVETGDGGRRYVWPSAFAYDTWRDVPEADREALRPLYGDDRFDGFERFGGYTGYRVGITPDGTWLFFVAGD